jgi:hypothetical protein
LISLNNRLYVHAGLSWENGKPLSRDEKMPGKICQYRKMRKAFAEWRSAREKLLIAFRLKKEWEYSARNGSGQ